jgi:4-amino-4-deoxy-L-arabinose transferase-like glycosyltransferase
LSGTPGPAWTHTRARPRRRRRRVLWLIAAVLTAATAFALGVALGQALEEKPDPGQESTTIVRTLTVPLEPGQTTGG